MHLLGVWLVGLLSAVAAHRSRPLVGPSAPDKVSPAVSLMAELSHVGAYGRSLTLEHTSALPCASLVSHSTGGPSPHQGHLVASLSFEQPCSDASVSQDLPCRELQILFMCLVAFCFDFLGARSGHVENTPAVCPAVLCTPGRHCSLWG